MNHFYLNSCNQFSLVTKQTFKRRHRLRGFIFVGLMNCDGEPKVIKYNCRMGDPETEVVILRIKSDLLDLLQGVAAQSLESKSYKTIDEIATTVVMVSGGYPGEFEKGKRVQGLEDVNESLVFYSGTKQDEENVLTNGGRVFAVNSFGRSIEDAVKKVF